MTLRCMEAVRRFARDFPNPNTPRGMVLQTDGSITAERPLWDMTHETREEWIARVRDTLMEGDYGIILVDAGMIDGHFEAVFAMQKTEEVTI